MWLKNNYFNKEKVKKYLREVKRIYAFLCVFFLTYFMWKHQELLWQLFDVADGKLALFSVLTWCVLHTLSPLSPQIIFNSSGQKIPYNTLLTIHLSRLPARYLPGGVWHTVGRYVDYHSLGISKKQLTLLVLLETILPCVITLLLGGSYLWLTGDNTALIFGAGLLACVSFIVLLAIPPIIFRRKGIKHNKRFMANYGLLVLLAAMFWVIASISFVFYYLAVSPNTPGVSSLHIAATYIFSWGIGYIAIFAPQGIGVFEVVAGSLLEIPYSLGGAVAFLAGYRVIMLVADSLCFAFFCLGKQQRLWKE